MVCAPGGNRFKYVCRRITRDTTSSSTSTLTTSTSCDTPGEWCLTWTRCVSCLVFWYEYLESHNGPTDHAIAWMACFRSYAYTSKYQGTRYGLWRIVACVRLDVPSMSPLFSSICQVYPGQNLTSVRGTVATLHIICLKPVPVWHMHIFTKQWYNAKQRNTIIWSMQDYLSVQFSIFSR